METTNKPDARAIARHLLDVFADAAEARYHALRCASNATKPEWQAAYTEAAKLLEQSL